MSAVVTKDKEGRFRIDVTLPNKQKTCIRLTKFGITSKSEADRIATNIRSLIACRNVGIDVQPEIQQWLQKIGDSFYKKLRDLDLVPQRDRDQLLIPFLKSHFAAHAIGKKTSSQKVWNRAINHAEKFFTKTTMVGSVTPTDAQSFRNWLRLQTGQQGKLLADATIAKTCGVIHQGFLAAIDKGMISKSPFASKSISKSPGANPATQTLVSSQDIENVISQANDASDRIILGLARLGGLRMPSEAVGLKWKDIDWDKRVIKVQSPKTAHQNKPSRLIPLFPKLYDLLKNEHANSTSEFLIPWLKPESNLNVRIRRQILATGMPLYPKVLQTLRASCVNDWIRNTTYSAVNVAMWTGHTFAVMFKHYIRVKDESFTSDAALDAAKIQSEDKIIP
jgi:integrase